MNAEDPAKTGQMDARLGEVAEASTDAPPDVDSLMSRLADRSDVAEVPHHPSAIELLGGRGRRRRALPASEQETPPEATEANVPRDVAPSPIRRSTPPPAPAPAVEAVAPVVSAAPTASAEPLEAQQQETAPRELPVVAPITPVVTPAEPAFEPLIPQRTISPDDSGPIQPQRIIALGQAATSSPRLEVAVSYTAPFTESEPTPPMPSLGDLFVSPAGLVEDEAPSSRRSLVPSTSKPFELESTEPIAPFNAPSREPQGPREVTAAALPPPPEPGATVARNQLPTIQNLDATVREALELLDRDDFETTTIEISVERDSAPEVTEAESPTSKKPPPPRKNTPASDPNLVASPSATAGPIASPAAAPPPAASPAASTVAPSSPITSGSMGPTAPQSVDSTGEPKKKKKQWFEEFFNDDFARTTPKLAPIYLAREVQFIDDSLGCEKGATILDLGCGAGEQAVALAARGYEVIGVDLSLAMLARAADEAAEQQQRINFVHGDMRELAFEEAFDGVYCWGTTFGFFEEGKNAEVIARVHRALRRGGRFLLDMVNRDFIVARCPSMQWFEGDGCICMDEVNMNAITSRLAIKRTMMLEDGRNREFDFSIRLYALHELGKLLHEYGFRVAEVSGDTATPGVYFGGDSPRLLILAEKR